MAVVAGLDYLFQKPLLSSTKTVSELLMILDYRFHTTDQSRACAAVFMIMIMKEGGWISLTAAHKWMLWNRVYDSFMPSLYISPLLSSQVFKMMIVCQIKSIQSHYVVPTHISPHFEFISPTIIF